MNWSHFHCELGALCGLREPQRAQHSIFQVPSPGEQETTSEE